MGFEMSVSSKKSAGKNCVLSSKKPRFTFLSILSNHQDEKNYFLSMFQPCKVQHCTCTVCTEWIYNFPNETCEIASSWKTRYQCYGHTGTVQQQSYNSNKLAGCTHIVRHGTEQHCRAHLQLNQGQLQARNNFSRALQVATETGQIAT